MIFRKRQAACVIYPLTDVRVAIGLGHTIGNRSPLNRLEAIMATIAAYLISLTIIGFGVWIFAVGDAQPASMLAGIVVGLMPIAVGLASLVNEIHNDLYS
jgi:ribose/xylose/arabinose/galactoside ABC-type transport system permease subunit